MAMKIKLILVVLVILITGQVYAATLYVDYRDGYCSECSAGSDTDYTPATRECGSGAATVYSTIQAAINASSSGDTIYMRGGTYNEYAISINASNASLDGSSWNPGQFTTLASYPGEWAVLDGEDAHDNCAAIQSESYMAYNYSWDLEYWKFERFEITGYESGFWMNGGPLWFRYLYIHHNNVLSGDNKGGIEIICPNKCIIEYCYLSDNGTSNENNCNIEFTSDQLDDTSNGGDGGAFDPETATVKNIIRYNYLSGSGTHQNFRHKNEQRFGYNSRNPATMTYADYGDEIHHNLILDGTKGLVTCQDFTQIHHNITNRRIEIGHFDGGESDIRPEGDTPIVYNAVAYNNTQVGSSAGIFVTAGHTNVGDTNRLNYYDNLPMRYAHNHSWIYNNIVNVAATVVPIRLMPDTLNDSATYDWDASDIVVENNLLFDCDRNERVQVGGDASGTGCGARYYTSLSSFNACSATWRSVDSVVNYEQASGSLFLGASGADQYITDGTFSVDTGITISDGGKNTAHPYLSGVTIPDYIGATDPDDITTNNWVDGLLNDLTSTTWLASTTTDRDENDDPTWIEGSESTPSTPSLHGVSLHNVNMH